MGLLDFFDSVFIIIDKKSENMKEDFYVEAYIADSNVDVFLICILLHIKNVQVPSTLS